MRSEERFRLATEAINGMIYDQDTRSGEVQRSDGLFELIGVHAVDAGRDEHWWVSRIHSADKEVVGPMIDRVREEKRELFDLEYRVLHELGHWVWVNDKGRLVHDEQGQLVRIVGCTTDISMRKKAEMELQRSDKRKDEFIATLAHELRNPLSPLQHAVDLLEDIADDRQMLCDMRNMMQRQMRHLVRLVDDLLDVGRISQGKIDLRRERIDLRDCVYTAMEANRHMLERMDHALASSLPDHPVWVYGDMERLTQVVSNLLNNAIKFTPSQGAIRVEVKVNDHHACLVVNDNGMGIDPDSVDRIFDMFVQHHNGSHGGLGIGLNLVRRLIVMHGGRVTARSQGPGKGASFIVELPVAEPIPLRNSSDQVQHELA
jgi:PAS domain S-box-containing protein